jgi:hypothetical protein
MLVTCLVSSIFYSWSFPGLYSNPPNVKLLKKTHENYPESHSWTLTVKKMHHPVG